MHFFSLIQVFIKLLVLHQFPDLGSYKYTLLDFCVTFGNLFLTYLNLWPVVFIPFTKFFMRPSIMCKGGISDVRLGQFIYIVIFLVQAVPLTQETAVFCVP